MSQIPRLTPGPGNRNRNITANASGYRTFEEPTLDVESLEIIEGFIADQQLEFILYNFVKSPTTTLLFKLFQLIFTAAGFGDQVNPHEKIEKNVQCINQVFANLEMNYFFDPAMARNLTHDHFNRWMKTLAELLNERIIPILQAEDDYYTAYEIKAEPPAPESLADLNAIKMDGKHLSDDIIKNKLLLDNEPEEFIQQLQDHLAVDAAKVERCVEEKKRILDDLDKNLRTLTRKMEFLDAQPEHLKDDEEAFENYMLQQREQLVKLDTLYKQIIQKTWEKLTAVARKTHKKTSKELLEQLATLKLAKLEEQLKKSFELAETVGPGNLNALSELVIEIRNEAEAVQERILSNATESPDHQEEADQVPARGRGGARSRRR